MVKRILFFAKNKFVIASAAFIIWMLFFDRNDLSLQMQFGKQKKELQAEKEFYEKEIAKIEKNLEELNSDQKKLEKFARENYLMKKENEDVYVIIEK